MWKKVEGLIILVYTISEWGSQFVKNGMELGTSIAKL
jgi:hypothetical protein